MFIRGNGQMVPFSLWHRIKRADTFSQLYNTTGYTTACDLYMVSVQTAETINDIPLMDEYCTTVACGMRKALSDALNKCASENRQSEWTMRY